jgi:uncharacterized protein with PIN domain
VEQRFIVDLNVGRLAKWLRTHSEFMECPECLRVYWRGAHWSNMRAELKRAIAEAL